MMGWAMFAAVALGAALFLALVRFSLRLWAVAGTALTLGAAGYAWQGSPSVPGHPVTEQTRAGEIDPNLVALREAMFGKFGTHMFSYSAAADSMTRTGHLDLATAVWLGATRKVPRDAGLWTGLGVALAEQDGSQVSPASKFAFEKAMALHPQHPGPPFFYGLSLVREGKFEEARTLWAKAVSLTPADASYRDDLVLRLFLLERLLAAQAAEKAGAPEGAAKPAAPPAAAPGPAAPAPRP